MGAALEFSNADARVNIGSDASLDNLSAGTYLALARTPSSCADDILFNKGNFSQGLHQFVFLGSGAVEFLTVCSGTNIFYETSTTYSGGTWYWFAATWDLGTSANFYAAQPGNRLTEASYAARTTGGGSVNDNSSVDMMIGGSNNAGEEWRGRVAFAYVFNKAMSEEELNNIIFDPFFIKSSECESFLTMGRGGTGTQQDLSGN
ncbi:MAG: LamG-like jellyroll fold domain-containing protein, partial [Opitutae bacterium]